MYFRAVVDDLAFPPEDPVVRASLEAEADDLGAEALYRRLAAQELRISLSTLKRRLRERIRAS